MGLVRKMLKLDPLIYFLTDGRRVTSSGFISPSQLSVYILLLKIFEILIKILPNWVKNMILKTDPRYSFKYTERIVKVFSHILLF